MEKNAAEVKLREKESTDVIQKERYKSWFSALLFEDKRRVFSNFTEDENGRYYPVSHAVTEEELYEIERKYSSQEKVSQVLESIISDLSVGQLSRIYKQCLKDGFVPSLDELESYGRKNTRIINNTMDIKLLDTHDVNTQRMVRSAFESLLDDLNGRLVLCGEIPVQLADGQTVVALRKEKGKIRGEFETKMGNGIGNYVRNLDDREVVLVANCLGAADAATLDSYLKPGDVQSVSEEETVKAEDRRPIDDLFGLSGEPGGENFGLAYERASSYLEDVVRKMSDHIGWKDASRPFDFSDFSGYYPDVQQSRTDIMHNGVVVASFYAMPDGRLGFEAPIGSEFDIYPPDVNPWYPLSDIMDGKFCLTQENLAAAMKETHNGNEVVYGLRYGDDAAFVVDGEDRKLRQAIVEREPNIRFVDYDRFTAGLDRWIEKDCRPGFEGDTRPEMLRYAWDGETLRSEQELSVDLPGIEQGRWAEDWKQIEELREGGEEIRRDLEKAAGVEGGRRFKFENALYPNLSMRDDALFLTTACGSGMSDFITASGGQIALYRGYNPDRGLSEPRKTFGSVREALDAVRGAILGESNVKRAKKDFELFKGKALSESRGRGI